MIPVLAGYGLVGIGTLLYRHWAKKDRLARWENEDALWADFPASLAAVGVETACSREDAQNVRDEEEI